MDDGGTAQFTALTIECMELLIMDKLMEDYGTMRERSKEKVLEFIRWYVAREVYRRLHEMGEHVPYELRYSTWEWSEDMGKKELGEKWDGD